MFFVYLGLALADTCFLILWWILGRSVAGDPVLAERHQLGGLFVCILTCFVHAVTFVYFLGTGLAVKEAHRNWGISQDYVRHTRRFKLRAYPIAMVAIVLIITTGILGGAVRSGSVGAAWHAGFAVAAFLVSLAAFVVAARTILRNGFMLGLIRQDIEEIRAASRRGEATPEVAPGQKPELLRRPEEIRRPPSGFLMARALVFLGANTWLLYSYLRWFLRKDGVSWVPFAALSLLLLGTGIYLRIRHPLPADVDF